VLTKNPENLTGNSYNWTPIANLPVDQNVLKIIDLDDQLPNYSLQFSIKGANASWVSTANPGATGTDQGGQNPAGSGSPPTSKDKISGTAKIAIAVAIPVVVIVLGVCIGLWLRNRRADARRGPLRTMSTDNTPTRDKPELDAYSTPVRQELHSDSSTRFNPIKRLFFTERELEPVEKPASPSSWDDDDAATPPNNHSTASPGEDEISASSSPRYNANYSRPQNNPESPTPQRRVVSAPTREVSFAATRQAPPPPTWELSTGTPIHSRAELAQPTPVHEFPLNQRNFSSPLPASSTASSSRQDNDPYAGITFGNSDDPDEIVAHLTAQRLKVRAEKERLRKLAELETAEEDIDRRIQEARQKRD